MMRPSPTSTLFPYTTLFRSLSARPDLAPRSTNLISEREFDVLLLAARGLPNKEIAARMGLSIRTVHSHLAKDRKSTRLNSSHRCISYAVFCLKKKNRTHGEP